ncbi:VOC family protein [Corynebacterium sp. A21]|uniref:VOC family protein n=1 Tax=Corynebacterium sp. A21 TaxID=3457318 RepID=UPI003FD3DFB4
MSNFLATYISLPGTTKEAFELWHDILGGELNVLTYGDTPMEGMPFEPDPKAVAHVTLRAPGVELAGGDQMPGDPEDYPIKGSAYSLLYTVDSEEAGRAVIDKFLQAGGELNMPFEQAPWGSWYGQVFDKFGVMWAISTSQ